MDNAILCGGVLVGMSGGVDSSLTASLLRDSGYSVVGGSLIMHPDADTAAAAATCAALDIPFASLDCSAEFEGHVASYLVDTYCAGRTPCPCVVCNRMLKLEMLCRLADSCGCEYIATGHYAGVGSEGGRYFIRRSPDPKKDQSYFLCMARQSQLARLLLPLSDITKAEVRERAKARGLAAAEKRDSQELCFIPDGKYVDYIIARRGEFPEGELIAPDGSVAGRHRGIIRYTVGQRKQLGVALGRPVFVSHIDAATNRVYLSDAGGEYSDSASLVRLNFQLLEPPRRSLELRGYVKHRAAAQPAPCTVELSFAAQGDAACSDVTFSDVKCDAACDTCGDAHSADAKCVTEGDNAANAAANGVTEGGVTVGDKASHSLDTDARYSAVIRFDTPARAVTPGQFCAVYDECGRILLGGEIV